jgi:heptosyltransferase-2/heptosyltransferase-3
LSSPATSRESRVAWLAWAALAFQAFFATTHFSRWLRPEYGGAVALLILVVAGGKRWRELARHPLPWLVLAFVIYAMLQAAYAARLTPELSFGKQLSYNAEPIRVGVLTCVIGAWLAERPRRMPPLLGLMAAGFVFAALVCTPWSRIDAIVTGTLRLRLGYAENIVGEYAAMGLLLLSLFTLSWLPRRLGAAMACAAFLVPAGVLLLACLLYAQSRAAWLAAALVVPIATFACLREVHRRWRRSAVIALGVATLAMIAALGVGYALVAHRLAGGETIAAALAQGELAELPSSPVTLRVQLAELGWHAWEAHPLWGIGLRSIQPLIDASGIHSGDYVPPHLHNAYLQTLVGLGIIGAGLLLAAFALLVRELWLAWRTGDAGSALFWALLGCLGIALIVNISDYLTWRFDYLRAPLELLLGCCFALSLRRRPGHATADVTSVPGAMHGSEVVASGRAKSPRDGGAPPTFAPPLVIRFGAFGDMVLLTPLLRMLHGRYGQRCRVLGSGGWLEPLFTGHPDVATTIALASRKRPYWFDASQQRLVAFLRAQPPGPVYVCDDYSVDKIRWLLARAGVAEDHCVFANPDCMLRTGEHWIDRWRRFGAMTPAAFANTPAARVSDLPDAPCLVIGPADRADLQAWLTRHQLAGTPLVLLQPGNKRTLKRGRAGQPGDDKRWPLANWTGLIHALLARDPGIGIILCGAPPEAAMLRTIAAAVHSPRVFAAGDELPLRRLLALCERAAAMISIDTGPAQAAAALGCPLVVLYGAQPPSLWKPRSPTGSTVIALGGLPDRRRVGQIRLEEVTAALDTLAFRAPMQAAC